MPGDEINPDISTSSLNAAPLPVSLAQAFRYWLKLGFISFGGPAGQIALMHSELVDKRRWISEQRFLHALNFCMLLPGPEATQLAVYIGWLMHRTLGGIIAGALFILPSLLILIGLSWVYLRFGNLPQIAAVLYGIKPAVIAIVLFAAWRIGSRTLRNHWLGAIASVAFTAISIFHVPFPAIVLAAALIGVIGGRIHPQRFQIGGPQHAKFQKSRPPAIIDDLTPPPLHAHFSMRKLIIVSATGLALGIVSWLAISAVTGHQQPLSQMGWFFSKAALLTFGGAYAVLPYVYQGAVDTFGWLSATQMMDDLALGETTPGPLIMIVAMVGFIGGWTHAVFGESQLFIGGLVGALVATWFTFLPSFIFILGCGPLIESSRGNIHLTAPLTAISAAVVGVIVSLAVFFAQVVFQTNQGFANWDWSAVGICLLACIGLFGARVGPIKLIVGCALIGLTLRQFAS